MNPRPEPVQRMQALSRTFIFLGILLVASVLASIAASVVAATLFGEAFSIAPGQAMPNDDSVWWQLHLQNLISQAVGFGGAAWVAHNLVRVFDASGSGVHAHLDLPQLHRILVAHFSRHRLKQRRMRVTRSQLCGEWFKCLSRLSHNLGSITMALSQRMKP